MTTQAKSGPKGPATTGDDGGETLPMDRGPASHPTAGAATTTTVGRGRRLTVLPRLKPGEGTPSIDHSAVMRYEEQELLGTGGMGEVVAAMDNDIGRTVAIKRLLPELQGEHILVRFAEEIRTIGSLEHPNIVPVHDVGVDESGRHYFVMKYVRGRTLESIIELLKKGDREAHRLYSFEERTRIFVGILEAVNYAHSRGVIHRDIKPSNVIVGPYGEVILTDWGIAKKIRDVPGQPAAGGPAVVDAIAAGAEPPASTHRAIETVAGALIGTPAYMSPEQACGEPLDERSDIYSLCVLFHELLSLCHYLSDCKSLDAMLKGGKEREPLHPTFITSPHQPPAPADLGWFVVRGLKKDPSERYTSVKDMIERLRRRREGVVPVQCPITFMKRSTGGFIRLVDRHPKIAISVFYLTVAGTLALLTLGGIRLVQALL